MDDTQRTGWQKRILLFLTSQCITLFGSTLVQMALVWYATMQTSSSVWVAAFTVCSYLPQFLISFIGGVWADRYHRKKLIIGADLLIAFVTFSTDFLDGFIISFPLYFLKFHPRNSNPSSMWVISVFSSDSFRPLGTRKSLIFSRISSSVSLLAAVTMK